MPLSGGRHAPKLLPVLLGLLLLAGCGLVGDGPLTRQEIANLPPDVLTQRLVMQMGLTVSDVPIERNRQGQIFLHSRGYDSGDGLCRQDVLYVRFDPHTRAEGPVVARGFTAEPTFTSLKARGGGKDCADPRLTFFRAHSFRGAQDVVVARDGMALFLKARASTDGAAMQCDDLDSATKDDCRAMLAAFPVDQIDHVFDCEPQNGGKCASLSTDRWVLTINATADGRIATVDQRRNLRVD